MQPSLTVTMEALEGGHKRGKPFASRFLLGLGT